MITGFTITNFRGIRTLQLDGLKQINVIAGKNSSGKTSVLEALLIYTGVNVSLAVSLNALRGISWLGPDMEQNFGPLFFDGRVNEAMGFRGWERGKNTWTLIEISLEPTVQIQTIAPNMTQVTLAVRPVKLSYSDYRNKKDQVVIQPGPDGALRFEASKIAPSIKGVYLRSSIASAQENVERFSRFDTENNSEVVINAMRCVEPRLRGLSVATFNGVSILYADVGLNRKIPLSYAGEGLQKIATIALGMAQCKDGVCLIDEIENGFHYSVLPKIWSTIAEFSKLFNVQVFATTHSFECIKAAYDALQSSSDGRTFELLRLDRLEDGGVKAEQYDREMIQSAIESGIEVR